MESNETVVFEDVTVKAETDKALLCVIGDNEYWIPKSQLDEDSEVFEKGTEGKLIITEWLAKNKGLI